MSDTAKVTCPRCGQSVTLELQELGSVIEGDRVTLRRLASGTHTCTAVGQAEEPQA